MQRMNRIDGISGQGICPASTVMSRYFPAAPVLILLACVLISSSACSSGSGTSESRDKGSIAFSVRFPDKPSSLQAGTRAKVYIDCGQYGITTVYACVYDAEGNLLAEGGPWGCDAGEGIIAGVAAGENRRVVIMCMDSNGNVIYQGEVTGILVRAGETADAGTISVTHSGNHAPVIERISNRTVLPGEPIRLETYIGNEISFHVSAADADGDDLTYEAAGLPPVEASSFSFALDEGTNEWVFTWDTSPLDMPGEYKVLFIVTDNGSPRMADYEEITIRVLPAAAGNLDYGPILMPIGPFRIEPGDALSFTPVIMGGGEIYFVNAAPEKADISGLININQDTHEYSWLTSPETAPGNYYFEVVVMDSNNASDTEEVTVTVGDANRPPVLTPIGSRVVPYAGVITIEVSATDPENHGLTYTVGPVFGESVTPPYPSSLSFDGAAQRITWNTAEESGLDQTSTYAVRVTVTDSEGESDFEDVFIHVYDGI